MASDNTYNAKIRILQGGDILDVAPGGKITGDGAQASAIADHSNPATATAEEIATKQNSILAALRAVGIIATE